MHPYPAGIAAHHIETTIESLAPDVTLRSPVLTAYRTRAALAHVSARPFAAVAPLYERMAERLITR